MDMRSCLLPVANCKATICKRHSHLIYRATNIVCVLNTALYKLLFAWNFGPYLHKSKMEVKINGFHINLIRSLTLSLSVTISTFALFSLSAYLHLSLGVVCGYFLGKYCGKYVSVWVPMYPYCSCRHHWCGEQWRERTDENRLQNTNTRDIKRT